MSEETKIVLQMLSDGKISADQAANLLQALSSGSPKAEGKRVFHSSHEDLHEATRRARQEAKEAAWAARAELREVKQATREAMREARERLREEKAALKERLRDIRENHQEELEDEYEELESDLEHRLEALDDRDEEDEEDNEAGEAQEHRVIRMRGNSFGKLSSVLGGLWGIGRAYSWEETKQGQFTGADIYRVTIHGVNGRITVEPTEAEDWRLTATKTIPAGSEAEARELADDMYSLEQKPDALVVRAKRVFGQSRTVHFHLRLPKGSKYDLDVRSTNGSVQVGSIDASRLRAATTNGKVEVESDAGEMELSSTNGRVEVRGCAAKVNCHTVNGRIAVECPAPQPGAMELTTVNGGITVRVKESPGLGIRFSGSAVSGGVSADLRDQQVLTDERRRVGRKLSVQTRGESTRWLNVTTRSVHGSINISQL